IGDMYPEILTIRSVFGDQRIVDDSLGMITKEFPSPCYPNNFTTYGMWYLTILWDWYLYTGRKGIIEDSVDYWKPLLKKLLGLIHSEKDPLKESEFNMGFFLDWATYETEDAKSGVCALFITALEAAQKICSETGERELEESCKRKIKILRSAAYKESRKKQITAFRALAQMDDKAFSADVLTKGKGKGMSTFMSYYILTATAKTAETAAALAMLKEYYGGMIKAGATPFWEDFDLDWLKDNAKITDIPEKSKYDIHGDNGRYCYKGYRHSLCHGWSGGPVAFLAETVLGVKILEPGCKKIAIKPSLGNLKWAKGNYPTPYGRVWISAWKNEDGSTGFDYNAPKEIKVVRV
ncbi:MAG: alpha-L-rhamnosidase, partial [Clostridia bacterium]|nr:alpha-L-rhamnosidase [Clostridia bacterium]